MITPSTAIWALSALYFTLVAAWALYMGLSWWKWKRGSVKITVRGDDHGR